MKKLFLVNTANQSAVGNKKSLEVMNQFEQASPSPPGPVVIVQQPPPQPRVSGPLDMFEKANS